VVRMGRGLPSCSWLFSNSTVTRSLVSATASFVLQSHGLLHSSSLLSHQYTRMGIKEIKERWSSQMQGKISGHDILALCIACTFSASGLIAHQTRRIVDRLLHPIQLLHFHTTIIRLLRGHKIEPYHRLLSNHESVSMLRFMRKGHCVCHVCCPGAPPSPL
jgi:hypothetical protein